MNRDLIPSTRPPSSGRWLQVCIACCTAVAVVVLVAANPGWGPAVLAGVAVAALVWGFFNPRP